MNELNSNTRPAHLAWGLKQRVGTLVQRVTHISLVLSVASLGAQCERGWRLGRDSGGKGLWEGGSLLYDYESTRSPLLVQALLPSLLCTASLEFWGEKTPSQFFCCFFTSLLLQSSRNQFNLLTKSSRKSKPLFEYGRWVWFGGSEAATAPSGHLAISVSVACWSLSCLQHRHNTNSSNCTFY